MVVPRAMHPVTAGLAGLFVFILLYNPTIAAVDASPLRLVVLYGVVAGVIASKWLVWSRKVVDRRLFLLGCFAIAFGGSQAIAMLGGGDTTLGALILACLTGYIPAAYVVARQCEGKSGRVHALLSLVALAGAFQAAFIILDWVSPAVHGLFSAIVVQPDLSKSLVRAAGLSSSAGDGLAFIQAFGAMSASYLALSSERRAARYYWAVIAALCLASIMLCGRTGFIMFAVFVLVMATGRSLAFGVARLIGAIAVGAGLAAAVVMLALPPEQLSLVVDRVLPYAFEFIYRYLAGEGFRTDSTDDLWTMLFLPSDAKTLLIGSGYYGDPINPQYSFMGTDIGYVRIVYYVGVIGSVLIYSWYLLLWRELRIAATSPVLLRFIDAVFIVMFVSQVKFPFLFLGTGLAIMFALLFALQMDDRRCASAV